MRATTIGIVLLWLLFYGIVGNLGFPGSDDFRIRSTADVALLFWAAAIFAMQQDNIPIARLTWTLGCSGYLIHAAAAFEYAHHWSHSEAFAHVERVSGYGEGIFVSYLFTIVWTGDALWWSISPSSYSKRPRRLNLLIHGFMGFIIFNATVVYENGSIRWAGIFVLAVLLIGWRRAGIRNLKRAITLHNDHATPENSLPERTFRTARNRR